MKNIDAKIKAAKEYTGTLEDLAAAIEELAECETKTDEVFCKSRIEHLRKKADERLKVLVELTYGNAKPITHAGSAEAVLGTIQTKIKS